MAATAEQSALDTFHDCTRDWFIASFGQPTRVQAQAWPAIANRENALLLAPTGSGKTLAAFLAAIDRMFFRNLSEEAEASQTGVRVVYVSPLKALGVDVDRNLRAPIAGLRHFAERHDVPHHVPSVAVRSGDTPQRERALIVRQPPDILITTPESLYLMLTSRAAVVLASVETVIVDEIHAMAGTKRGAHLFVTLERLERLRATSSAHATSFQPPPSFPHPPSFPRRREPSAPATLQRIGLSATQRPLEEIARLLGGGSACADPDVSPTPRRVTIIDASERRRFDLTVEMPAEEQETVDERTRPGARLRGTDVASASADYTDVPNGPAGSASSIPSVWPSIHPRLVELIRANRSTMIFANSRRLAERLASAINELAGEELALAHHGSISKDTRLVIEDRLKRGDLPAIVATSSMELGIDMGAVDLVIQIEAPPTIASGTQRIGRAGHQVGAISTGVIFPKYKGDLLACSAATGAMMDGWVEETHYPRNPIDILAQQIVAVVARETIAVDDLYSLMRGAAPFFDLPRSSFEGVLDLLSGRYPSDEFSELRPRINWDRNNNTVSGRRGAQRLAILNGGTIPDRGLYGVFLIGDGGESGGRVGELDEEMVFECRPGDVFLLGASSWRVMDITRDRVLVVPAPGEPGRMPFWKGDSPGRPREFGQAIGRLARELTTESRQTAVDRLTIDHGLQPSAANSLLDYLNDQIEATGELPSDAAIVVESFPDEVGDWRLVILSPFGARVHAPWAMLVAARLREATDTEVDVVWTDDGILFRVPEAGDLPEPDFFFPEPDEVEDELIRHLGDTALFAAKFRENAGRSLLLPRRSPGRRTPLWLQRRKSGDLLKVAARYREFPILMETYRECLRDVFDVSGLVSLLRDVKSGTISVKSVRRQSPSPFASAALFSFVGNFVYEGDAPLAARRAASLTLDHTRLRELLGTVNFRELFDPVVVAELLRELQRIPFRCDQQDFDNGDGAPASPNSFENESGSTLRFPLRDADDVHGLLLDLGPLSVDEIRLRAGGAIEPGTRHLDDWRDELVTARRIFPAQIAGEERFAAAEDASRLRDALNVQIPHVLADAFRQPVAEPLIDLVSRYARSHTPFTAIDVAARFGLDVGRVLDALAELSSRDRVVEGEFLQGGDGREWCDRNVLRTLKRRSLAAIRRQVEAVDTTALARFLPVWHGITRPRRGLDGLLDAIEQLQGIPLPASSLENEILPARVTGFRTADLDELCVAGEVIWQGFDSTGNHDGRVALYLTDSFPLLSPAIEPLVDDSADRLRTLLADRGALFFEQICGELRGFPNDVLDVLWRLVWNGEITNDTLTPLRSLRAGRASGRRSERGSRRMFRSRRQNHLAGSEGRWTLPEAARAVHSQAAVTAPSVTERQAAIAAQLIQRHGIVTKNMLSREHIAGGFAGLYPVLKAMEEAGRVRRGYFVAGLGAAQFAAVGADDRLRSQREPDVSPEPSEPLVLAATDPANPWAAFCRGPKRKKRPVRSESPERR
ncbi:MAG: crosslink repair DNA glycosylase YcaQ family protein [Planctomycetaceae bacterium]